MGLNHKRKGPARPSLEELPAKKALAGTLLEQEQELINTGKQKRKRRTRGFEASVGKALRDNFVNRGWDPSWLDMLSFDGKTIREYVTEAKRAQALGTITTGKYFYHDLRMKFQDIGNQDKEMVVDDPEEPEDPRIAEAMCAMFVNAVDLALVSDLMEENYVPPNQKNAKALFSAFLEIPFSTEKGSTFLCRALMYIAENTLHNDYPPLFDAVKQHLDRALEKNYMILKSAGLSPALWMQQHIAYIGLIVPAESLKTCVENPASWNDVAQELRDVCKSICGRRIFGSKLASIASVAIGKEMEALIQKLEGGAITVKSIKDMVTDMQKMAMSSGRDFYSNFGSEQKVTFDYLGMQCHAKVSSLYQEMMVKTYALVKGRGVRLGKLEPLWCELQLVCETKKKPPHDVDDAVLHEAKVARKAALELAPSADSAEIKCVLNNKHKLLQGMDRWWQVERDFWLSVVGPAGEASMRCRVAPHLGRRPPTTSWPR